MAGKWFIIDLNGSNLRPLTHGGLQKMLLGWLADGSLLYSVTGRENEST